MDEVFHRTALSWPRTDLRYYIVYTVVQFFHSIFTTRTIHKNMLEIDISEIELTKTLCLHTKKKP